MTFVINVYQIEKNTRLFLRISDIIRLRYVSWTCTKYPMPKICASSVQQCMFLCTRVQNRVYVRTSSIIYIHVQSIYRDGTDTQHSIQEVHSIALSTYKYYHCVLGKIDIPYFIVIVSKMYFNWPSSLLPLLFCCYFFVLQPYSPFLRIHIMSVLCVQCTSYIRHKYSFTYNWNK